MESSFYHTCPLCGEKLNIKSTLHGNVYNCPSCKGVMANLAVLRGRVGHATANSFWQEANISGKASKKECPLCRQPMIMFTADPDALLLSLDICKQCQLIWFDKNEFEKIPQKSVQLQKGMVQEMILVDLQLHREARAMDQKMDLAIKVAEGLAGFFAPLSL